LAEEILRELVLPRLPGIEAREQARADRLVRIAAGDQLEKLARPLQIILPQGLGGRGVAGERVSEGRSEGAGSQGGGGLDPIWSARQDVEDTKREDGEDNNSEAES
jgi:hypothetical protein